MLNKQILLILTFVLFLCGCYSDSRELPSSTLYSSTECEFVLDQLNFGLNTPDGKVSEEEWNKFVNNIITLQFPDGFTVIDAHGQWRGKNGEIIKENTKLVQIVHENKPEINNKIEKIVREYKTEFSQESVLRIVNCQEVRF